MARPPSTSLTPAQRRVLNTVLKREGLQLPNFVSDLVAELSLKAESSLGPTLQRMARLGVILLQGGGIQGRQRLVVATHKGRLLSSLAAGATLENENGRDSPQESFLHTHLFSHAPPRPSILPLLGTIPAGPLEEVITQQDAAFETVSVNELLRHRPGDFLLRIKGESMVGDGILNGDLVLLRPGVEIQQGEIAAVVWSGSGAECEATLKRVFKQSPSNPSRGPSNPSRGSSNPSGGPSNPSRGSSNPSGGSSNPGEGRAAPFHEITPEAEEAEIENQLLLRASNPAYADILLPASSVRIAGVFRGLIRPEAPPSSSHRNAQPGGSQ